MKLWKSTILVLAGLSAMPALAEVRLPKMISDHAVLQRNHPIHIWGWAAPAARLNVRFHQQTVSAEADRLGKWGLYLQPEVAGGPYELSVTGDGPEVKVQDLLIGDVWFASGQSNMEMPLRGFANMAVVKDSEKEIAAANNPKLRLLVVGQKSSEFPLDDIGATWTTCTPETAKTFSAVAYFFGREIASKENVPVGLIDSSWGGTPAEAWTSLETLGTNPALLPVFASRAAFASQVVDTTTILAAEKREDEAAIAAGKSAPSHAWRPPEASWRPAGLYNAMVAPFTPMTLTGFIWYQGEANTAHDRAVIYDSLFGSMIGDWRKNFAQGDLPFLYVQISSFSASDDWALVREQQRRVLSVANTAMAVTLDVGQSDNVHPADKQTVGARLAVAARALAYGEKVAYNGPTFRQATTELGKDGATSMRVWFDHGAGLTYRGKHEAGFELAGPDHHFVAADSRLEGSTVVVSSTSVRNPRYVRYGWTSVVPENLFNADGFPASTFTSEPSPGH